MNVEEKFLDIVKNKYNNSETILSALNFAKIAHKGQFRDSGEPYIVHPLCVAIILSEYGLDEPAIVAALFHDLIEDTSTTFKQIKEGFGKEVEQLVKGVTKVNSIKTYLSGQNQNYESLRRMFISMAKDIRVVLIKLADRLHNMRTLDSLSHERQIKIATETENIYVPLADRLGLCSLHGELDDLCLLYLHPNEYHEIESDINRRYTKCRQILQTLEKELKEILVSLGIKGEVYGRIKHISSIYHKLKRISADKIFDYIALRVIVKTIPNCYAVLGAIHNKWKPIAGLIKDYIASPKLNGYQSLHSTLLTSSGVPFELQIRTQEMHKTCEYGIAAHWRYKDGDNHDSVDFAQKLDSIKQMVESNKILKDSEDFVNAIRLDFETSEIWVFTPQNKVISLQKGSTPIDFAYAIHSKIGNNCVGAKINGKMTNLDTKLETGDKVEIITSPHDKAPSRDWLNIVCMSSTKSKIRSYFRKEMKSENIERGKEMLDLEAKNRGLVLQTLLTKEGLNAVYKTYTLSSEEDLYAAVGSASVSTNQILNRLISEKQARERKTRIGEPAGSFVKTAKATKNNQGVLVYGEDDVLVKLCKNCSPIPGDEIVGFSVGHGITVHRKDCDCITSIEKEREVAVSWIGETADEYYNVNFDLKIVDDAKILTEIINILSTKKIYINSITAKTHTAAYSIAELSLNVKNMAEMQEIINKLSEINGVLDIKRK